LRFLPSLDNPKLEPMLRCVGSLLLRFESFL